MMTLQSFTHSKNNIKLQYVEVCAQTYLAPPFRWDIDINQLIVQTII